MKNLIMVLAGSIAIMLVATILFIPIGMFMTREQYDAEKAGKTMQVSVEKLNMRKEAGVDKEIIYTLREGDSVTLTGYHKEATWGGDKPDHWYKVIFVTDEGEKIEGWSSSRGLEW